MHIYQIYISSTAGSHYFKTKAKAKKFIKNVLYKEDVTVNKDDEDYMTLDRYIYENGIEINKIKVEK